MSRGNATRLSCWMLPGVVKLDEFEETIAGINFCRDKLIAGINYCGDKLCRDKLIVGMNLLRE